MKRSSLLRLVAFLLCLLPAVRTQSAEAVRLISDHAVSPDGMHIVFSWRGDLWKASTLGGDIERLTFHGADDRHPAYSPDGRFIAFVSSRTGSRQIFEMPSTGGSPRQVTQHTEGHRLLSYAPSGEHLLIQIVRDHFWYDPQRLALQPLSGNRAPWVLFDDYADDADLSPDGQQLLFVREGGPTWRKRYTGSQSAQIWLREGKTGQLRPLHQSDAEFRHPRWLPDGKSYITSSQESGTFNLQRVTLATGATEALTSFKGTGALFPAVARRSGLIVFRHGFDLMRLDPATKEIRPIPLTYAGDPTLPTTRNLTVSTASDATFTGDGLETAFIANGDVYVMDTELKEPVRVTDTPTAERSPVFSKDMKQLYFIGDVGGHPNIMLAKGSDPTKPLWLNRTFEFETLTKDHHSKSDLRLYADGSRLAFYQGTDVAGLDLKNRSVQVLIPSWNRPEYRFSPDSKFIAYAVADENYNSDIWIKPLDGSREPYNVSVHPDNDRNPVWSADGTILAFTGRRWGDETDIVYVQLSKAKGEETDRQRRLEKAMEKMKEREKKTSTKKSSDAPKTDAEKPAKDAVSGEWKGTIKGTSPIPPSGLPFTMNLVLDFDQTLSGTFSSALGTAQIVSGTYDPKTHALSARAMSDGMEVQITGTLTDGTATGEWSSPMGTGTWTATRSVATPTAGATTPPPGDKPAEEKSDGKDKPKEKDKAVVVHIDFDGLRDRLQRISLPNSSERGLIFGPEGRTLYFSGMVNNDRGTFSVEFPDKLAPKKVSGEIPSNGEWLEDKKRMGATVGGKPAIVTTAGAVTSFNFTTRTVEDIAALHGAIFDEAWRAMRDGFYDQAMGGNDWDQIREHYRTVASECLDAGSLSEVVNMMLGDLNASHLGFRYGGGGGSSPSVNQWNKTTGHLGARFETHHQGPGFRVRDVLKETPADREDSKLRAGELILAVDGVEVIFDKDPSLYFSHVPDHEFSLKVRGVDGAEREVRIRPTTFGRVRNLLYEEWVEGNRRMVDEASKGTLAYVHIAGMGTPELYRFDEELHRVGYGKDGLIIDVRNNGGGSTTDHLLTMLTQPTHALTKTREGPVGYPHDRRVYATWDKPIAVLCNQNSFSNAEIFSHAIKVLKRGKVIGVPTAGGVISTGGASLLGGAFIRMPGRGWYVLDTGEDMELNGCVPNIVLWPHPTEMPQGKDRQLQSAVTELSKDVTAWKNRPTPVLKKASER